jgi:hypothetical protein
MAHSKKKTTKGSESYNKIVVDRESMLGGKHKTGRNDNKMESTVSYFAGRGMGGNFPDPTDIAYTKPDQVVSTPGAVNFNQNAATIVQDCVVDMTMDITSTGMRAIIKECVKNKLFRCVKFFDREKHGFYSENLNTACGLVMKFCNIAITSKTQALAWWREVRPLVIKTISDHRNNCIKSMRTNFLRKYDVSKSFYFVLQIL